MGHMYQGMWCVHAVVLYTYVQVCYICNCEYVHVSVEHSQVMVWMYMHHDIGMYML